MWVFCEDGFFSAVALNKKQVVVRGRFFADLINLLAKLNIKTKIIQNPHRDYRYRIIVDKTTWGDYLKQAAERIDYPNFKATMTDDARHDLYLKIWVALKMAQDRAA